MFPAVAAEHDDTVRASPGIFLLELIKKAYGWPCPAEHLGCFFSPHKMEEEMVSHLPVGFCVSVGVQGSAGHLRHPQGPIHLQVVSPGVYRKDPQQINCKGVLYG